MAINWFPGHMHKATGEIRKLLPQLNVIIEVLDARIPYSSQNPVIRQFSREKHHIKLLNKSDLADPIQTQLWLDHFNRADNTIALAVNQHQSQDIKRLHELCLQLVPRKEDDIKPLQALITGIPNVGKSTIINILADRIIAKTGNEPAVTKAQQRIKISDQVALIDTPGILWPKFDNQHNAYRLAVTGAIKDTAISYDDIAFYAADSLIKHYPELLKQRYKLDTLPDTELEFLDTIGTQRGCLAAGGIVDLNKIGKIFINEFRAGTIGAITLESPAMMQIEELETAKLIEKKKAEKEAKKAARQAKRRKR